MLVCLGGQVQQQFEVLFQVGVCCWFVWVGRCWSSLRRCSRWECGVVGEVRVLTHAHSPPPPHQNIAPPPQFKALVFIEELASILLTPLLLYRSLPQCAGECVARGAAFVCVCVGG